MLLHLFWVDIVFVGGKYGVPLRGAAAAAAKDDGDSDGDDNRESDRHDNSDCDGD